MNEKLDSLYFTKNCHKKFDSINYSFNRIAHSKAGRAIYIFHVKV